VDPRCDQSAHHPLYTDLRFTKNYKPQKIQATNRLLYVLQTERVNLRVALELHALPTLDVQPRELSHLVL
jgi:hypothetical protein